MEHQRCLPQRPDSAGAEPESRGQQQARGEGFHHISIDVDRLNPLLAQLEADGVRIVDRFDFSDDLKTAFISPRSAHGVLIQFWQQPWHRL